MPEEEARKEEEPSKNKNNKYRKDKPWDSEDIDHWKVEVRNTFPK